MLTRAIEDAARLTAAEGRLADRDASLGAFGEAFIALSPTPDGQTGDLLGEPSDQDNVRRILFGGNETGDVVAALAASSPENADRLERLRERGAPCDFIARTPRGALRVQGRASAGAAWLKLSGD